MWFLLLYDVRQCQAITIREMNKSKGLACSSVLLFVCMVTGMSRKLHWIVLSRRFTVAYFFQIIISNYWSIPFCTDWKVFSKQMLNTTWCVASEICPFSWSFPNRWNIWRCTRVGNFLNSVPVYSSCIFYFLFVPCYFSILHSLWKFKSYLYSM